MNQEVERIYFNQNMLFFKDKIFNSGGALEISICSSSTDYKTFSPLTLHFSVIGENNLRRLCSLCYSDCVDLFMSLKNIMNDIDSIYQTAKNNLVVKKYQFDRSLKFEFVNVQTMNERVVSISVIHSNSDFAKVVVPFNTFQAFYVGILKTFVSEYVNISLDFTNRNLLTELLEQSKMIKNGIQILPTSLIEGKENIKLTQDEFTKDFNIEQIEAATEDFNKFLGNDMENIKVPDLENKNLLEEKSKNSEVKSLFITNTLDKDLSVLESMLTAATTTPDPLNVIIQGFSRSMNLGPNFNFLPEITKEDYKSLTYISKLTHDFYLNLYFKQNNSIPSSFPILKYKVNDLNKIDLVNINLSYDLLLIGGFIKIFRGRMESRESDANKNGALFYLKLRTILDPLVYSFLDVAKSKIIFNTVCTNFELYNEFGFFNYYQKILTDNGFNKIELNDIRDFCNELNTKVFSSNALLKNIHEKHDDLFKSGFLKIKSDNNLSIEQIINEFVPLEILEKGGLNVKEDNDNLNVILKELNISKQVLDVFRGKEIKTEEKKKETNLLKTVKYFNNEVPEKYRKEFFDYIDSLKLENYDLTSEKFPLDELGENIIKTIYVWNNSEKKDEQLTSFRAKLEECILTKDLILTKSKNPIEQKETIDEWNIEL